MDSDRPARSGGMPSPARSAGEDRALRKGMSHRFYPRLSAIHLVRCEDKSGYKVHLSDAGRGALLLRVATTKTDHLSRVIVLGSIHRGGSAATLETHLRRGARGWLRSAAC
jgi:hypothetical protein